LTPSNGIVGKGYTLAIWSGMCLGHRAGFDDFERSKIYRTESKSSLSPRTLMTVLSSL